MNRIVPTSRPRRLRNGRRNGRRIPIVPIVALATLLGCASSSPPGPAVRTVSPPPPASLTPAVRDADPRLGIEVRQWLVEADAPLLASTIAAWADEGQDATPGLLLEEGFSVATGPSSELVAVLTALGGTRTDLKVWHGQALEWRDLSGVNLPGTTIAIAGGRPLAVPPGRLALRMRGWIQPMEEGAACEIELSVRWKAQRRSSIGLETAVDDGAAWIGDLAMLRSVERGQAIVIVSVPPPIAIDGSGPPVETPPTLGELVLAPPAPGLATVLVIWPNLPDWLFPGADGTLSHSGATSD